MEMIFIGVIYVLGALIIAHYYGREYRIGFLRSFIFSLANPVLGYFLTIQSGKKRNKFNPFKSK